MAGNLKKLKLEDGRILGYREYGDPAGIPIINNHGGLVCGRDVETAHSEALKLGLRLISPNRPGVGVSSKLAGRRTLDWAKDVEQLVDFLKVEHFHALGWSMGGQYALACGAHFSARVRSITIIAGAVPLDDEKTLQELNQSDRTFTRLCREQPGRAAFTFRLMRWLALLMPKSFLHIITRDFSPPDESVLHQISIGRFAAWYIEATQQIAGTIEEYRAWARPWGFALKDIYAPVTVYRAPSDTLIPESWAQRIAAEVPRGTYLPQANGGHFFAQVHWRPVLEKIANSHSFAP
jgi:pimeloyl-ACP methyl ester carboxylesterase